jgi:HD-like signal output (HDOD) protein
LVAFDAAGFALVAFDAAGFALVAFDAADFALVVALVAGFDLAGGFAFAFATGLDFAAFAFAPDFGDFPFDFAGFFAMAAKIPEQAPRSPLCVHGLVDALSMVTFRAPSAPSPDVSLASQVVQQLRTQEPRIPPYPAVAGAIERLTKSGTSMQEITSIISKDASIVAAILRRAASASKRVPGVLTLEAAVARLGMNELMQVVTASGFGATAMRQGPLSVLRRDVWRRSLLSGMFCKEIAPRRGLDGDQAFVAGLLHDFGAVVVLACVEAMPDAPKMPEHAWQQVVDEAKTDLGMIVAARWQLPEQIADVMANHRQPMLAAKTNRPLVELIAQVDQVIAILDRGADADPQALSAVKGFAHDELAAIVTMMPRVSEQLRAFDVPADKTMVMRRPLIESGSIAPVDGWPVDFVVEGKAHAEHRATMIGPNTMVFTSTFSYPVAWLADLTLHGDDANFTILANVKQCDKVGEGSYIVTVQPFGLGGDVKAAWTKLVTRTRRAA